uniref:Uncharacterized protein n=1 Tax=Octopus bimaculoides TaxID=37653 RepID=A0A0L8GZL0_OCTBM
MHIKRMIYVCNGFVCKSSLLQISTLPISPTHSFIHLNFPYYFSHGFLQHDVPAM